MHCSPSSPELIRESAKQNHDNESDGIRRDGEELCASGRVSEALDCRKTISGRKWKRTSRYVLIVGRKPLTEPRVRFMQLSGKSTSAEPSDTSEMVSVPVHDCDNISLPIREGSSDTSPVDSGIRFVEAVLVESRDADDSLVFVQVA